MTIEFVAWPKTSRLFRDVVVTEKIDGTNAAIQIVPTEGVTPLSGTATVNIDGTLHYVHAQSRKRLIKVGDDNFGFAAWVWDNASEIANILGPGVHFGEWWGKGVQRGYNQENKRFSLFNTSKWEELYERIDGVVLDSVPVLYSGTFSEKQIVEIMADLKEKGSVTAPGFMKPEGICIYHTQSGKVYKVTLDHNDAGKWEYQN